MSETYFLPDGYRVNPVASADDGTQTYWGGEVTFRGLHYQVPVYRLAAARARQISARTVVDIGCGAGDKLVRFFGGRSGWDVIGVDQPSGVSLAERRLAGVRFVAGDLETPTVWEDIAELRPDLVICADVIEHLADPSEFLVRLRAFIGSGLLMLSTPDRTLVEDSDPLGPPLNPLHVREWSTEELAALVTRAGFTVAASHHLLPRDYPWTLAEARRSSQRIRAGRAALDTRQCQVLELTAGSDA